MSSLVITSIGIPKVRRALDRLSHLDIMDLLGSIGALVESQVRERITQQEGPPEGGDWDEYSPAYAQWKASKGKVAGGKKKGRGFLRLHGHLLDSIQYLVSRDEVAIGPAMPKAVYPEVNQAQRPYLGLSDENADEVEQITVDWLRQVMGFTI